MTGCGYDGHAFCVESQLDVAERRRHVIDIQTELDGGIYFTLSYASPHVTTSGCGCLKGCFERPTISGRKIWF
jgi:hypothetical protein